MTILKNITAMTTALALGVTALAPAAGAHDGPRNYGGNGGYGGYNGYSQQRNYDRGYDRGYNRGYDNGPRGAYAYRRHKRDNTGKYIALGVGALMLGIIASEASRR
jgi:hypothetical protein